MSIYIRLIAFSCILLASSVALATKVVPIENDQTIKSQIRQHGYSDVMVTLYAEFEPNPERLTAEELSEQKRSMAVVVEEFVDRMIKTKRTSMDDFYLIEGARAPILTIRITRKNLRLILSDEAVEYYSPVIR